MPFQQSTMNKGQFRHRIQEVKLEPQISAYDITIEWRVDGARVHKLPAIKKGQLLCWKELCIPCDVNEGSTITLHITEIHTIQNRTDQAEYQVWQRMDKGVISIKSNQGMFEAKIKPLDEDAANQFYAEALIKVHGAAKHRGLIEKAGRAGDVFRPLISLASKLAEIDPTGGAKVAFSAFAKAWEDLEKQEKQDTEVYELAKSLGRMIPSIDSVKDLADDDLKETGKAMMNLIEDVSVLILTTKRQSTLGKMLHPIISPELQSHAETILWQFNELSEEFSRRVSVQALRVVEMNRVRKELRELKPVDLASYDPSRLCMEATRVDIVAKVTSWTQESGDRPRFAWVYGLAGIGKSSIATSVCKQLDQQQVLACSFFCKRDTPELRDPRRVLTTIVYGLALRWKDYGKIVVAAIHKDPELYSRHLQPIYDTLVSQPLQSIASTKLQIGRMVIVVDALDECGDPGTRRQLMICLQEMCRLVPMLRVVVTSRPDLDIHEFFRLGDTDWYTEFDVLDYDASADIKVFVENSLGHVAGVEGWPNDATDRICAQSGGLFIWARTACKFIVDGFDRSQCLDMVLAGGSLSDIDSLYATAIRSSIPDASTHNMEYMQRCLGAVVVTAARRPLSAHSLAAISQGQISLDGMKRVLARLSSVLYEDGKLGGCIRIFHPSFMDYITTLSRSRDLCVDLERYNTVLAGWCLDVMSVELRFNMCELETSDVMNYDVTDLKARVSVAFGPHLCYSCTYWSSHVADANSPTIENDLRQFLLGSTMVYWLESLSLLGNLSIAPASLLQVMEKFNEEGMWDYWTVTNDVYRFVLAFYDPISRSTPHLYVSALAFAPSSSSIFKRTRQLLPNLLTVREGGETDWSPCLRTISVGSPVHSVAVSPDGQRIASGCDNGTVCIWDAETGEAVFSPLKGHSRAVYCVAFSHDSHRVVSGSSDEEIRVWDTQSGDNLLGPLQGHLESVKNVACSLDGRLIASSSEDCTIRLWNASTGEFLHEPLRHSGDIRSIAFSPDSQRIVSISHGAARVWDTKTGSSVLDLMTGSLNRLISASFSADSRQVVSVSTDGTVHRWCSQTGEKVTESLHDHSGRVLWATFSPDGNRIASLSHGPDHSILLWDIITGEMILRSLTGHSNIVNSAAFSPNKNRIVSGAWDGTVRIWDTTPVFIESSLVELSTTGQGCSGSVTAVAFSSDGCFIASGFNNGTLRIWDAESGSAVLGPLEGHSDLVQSVVFSPDDSLIASCSEDKTIRIWDTKSGKLIHEPLRGHSAGVRAVAFSPCGRMLTTGSSDKTVRIWSTRNGGAVLKPLTGHSDEVCSVAFSPDGHRAASGSRDRTLRLWDIRAGKTVLGPLKGHEASPIAVEFSSDGLRLTSGDTDSAIRVWDTQTGDVILNLEATGFQASCIAFSHKGRRIVSGSDFGWVHIWDAKTGNQLLDTLQGHMKPVQSVAISPGDRRIASGADDGAVLIWDAQLPMDLNSSHDSQFLPGTRVQLLPQSKESEDRLVSTGLLMSCINDTMPGWVTTTDGRPLLWLPHELRDFRRSLVYISSEARPRRVIDLTRFVHGEQWRSVVGI